MEGFLFDITERKAAEREIHEIARYNRSLVEASLDPLVTISPEGKITDVNRATEEVTGYSREHLIGTDFSDYFSDPGKAREGYRSVFQIGFVQDYPLEIKNRNGAIREVLYNAAVFHDDSGNVKGVFAAARDITERKRAEKALRESERKYRTLVETLNEGIWVIDKDAVTTFVNPKMAMILGYTIDEMIGRSLFSFMDDEGRRVAEWNIERRKQGIKEQHYFEFLQKDGTRIYASLEATPLIGKDEEYLGAIAGVVDISDRKRAEDLLHESENKFTSMFQGSPIALTLVSAIDGIFVNVNDAFMRATGYTHDEVIGKTSEALGIFADRNEGELLAATIRAHHAVQDMEVACRIKTGEIRPCLFSSSLIRINGKPYILSTITDITARKQAQDALRESEEKFREIFENVNDAITVLGFTPDGLPSHFTEVNENACRISGFPREEMLSMSPKDLDDPREWNEAFMYTQKIMERGYLVFERTLVRKDGIKIPIEISTHVFILNNQKVMLSLFRDITERKQAEEAIRQANRKLKLLSSITRHDINNQLLVLNGYVRLLQNKASDVGFEDFFTRITNASSRISSMIQFTKEYENIGITAPVWQETRALVDTAAKEAPLGKVTVKNNLPAGTDVFADPLVIKVFYNLMDNAARYGGTITTIEFSAEEREGNNVIVCEDDGNGIPTEEKEKIFERGFGKNTGLGLALAREILDISGITLTETGEPGKGARFEMTVPKGMWRDTGTGGTSTG